jgi:thiol-disulfide isomerase/thioredoxin
MTRRFSLILALLFVLSAAAEPLKLDTLKVGTTIYTNVTVLGANATDLYFRHSLGFANVKLKYVSSDLQKRFDYDAKAAEEAERRQNENDLIYQTTLAKAASAPKSKSGPTNPKPLLGSETGLSDTISERSLLGKPAPSLEVEKWLGEKPALEGKFVLISFWASWSAPCRQLIPELNKLQKKYAEKLAVVGVSAESEADLSNMSEPRMEYASAVDSKAKLSAAAGITSIPCVLLCDPKGTVLYQGHPGAITEKKLEAILSRATE